MQLHMHLTPSLPHRHPLAAVDVRHALERSAVVLLSAYGLVCIIWAFSDSGAPDLLVGLGLYALIGALAATLAPRLTGVVVALSSVAGVLTALAARWLGQTYATTLDDLQLAALFAVPFAAGALLLAAGVHRRQRERGTPTGS
jgi:uncharacterized membrane protein YeaQ/YmgE (transglycosylase-associated protein family)